MPETPAGRIPIPSAGAIPRAEWRNICGRAGLPFNHESISFLWLDHEVRVLTEALRRKGLLDNTIIVFAGDHGNEPGKGTCYHTGSRIPIVMAGPGIPAGAVFEEFAQNVDILPSILGLAGLPAPVGIDGRDLAAVWRGESPAREEVYMENGFSRSLRTESWKYIAKARPCNRREVTGPDGSHLLRDHYGATWEFPALRIAAALHPGYFHCEELYNLTDDPLEQRNLAADLAFHEALSNMRRRFGAIQQSLPDPMTAPDGWNPASRIIMSTMENSGTQSVPWWPDAESRYARHFVGRNFS
jgi:arylsulfatase A-like enzyme